MEAAYVVLSEIRVSFSRDRSLFSKFGVKLVMVKLFNVMVDMLQSDTAASLHPDYTRRDF